MVLATFAAPARADLAEYLKRPEPKFAWALRTKTETPLGTMYELHLVSQVWQDIPWEHELVVYQPKGVAPAATMLLWNTGGKPGAAGHGLALELATRVKAPVAFLYGIPNQPLFNGKKEDALIAETFVRYLETKDETWPLLFPMAKSLVKAMDALQAFAKQEWKSEVKDFVVSGASKRGWTSWMTAAGGDPRVKAIAPLVIDTLNMRAQMPHQVMSFGAPSEQIRDYTERGLVPVPDTPEAKKLWQWVDPWVYRDKLTLPKMIINGTNDPYWSLDATNLYWDDLKGDKWLLYVPNAGHGLQQDVDGKKDHSRVIGTLAAFTRHQITNKPMPKLSWKHGNADGKLSLAVTSEPAPKSARLWVADSKTRDFRPSKWAEAPAKLDGGSVSGAVDKPADGWRACFAECEFEIDGVQYFLSTQLRMAEAAK
jgi:PhoPQ-activated pathogenicity-related protein